MEFSTEYWASHRRGAEKRGIILRHLQQNPEATVVELMEICQLSSWQVRRHLSTLRQDGRIPVGKILSGNSYICGVK
jgi:predicted ArsR family transcriptional regulator